MEGRSLFGKRVSLKVKLTVRKQKVNLECSEVCSLEITKPATFATLQLVLKLSHSCRNTLKQGFSQKAVQPSYGRTFLEEIQGKCTYSLIILWENMPSGRPIFNVWLKACFEMMLWSALGYRLQCTHIDHPPVEEVQPVYSQQPTYQHLYHRYLLQITILVIGTTYIIITKS